MPPLLRPSTYRARALRRRATPAEQKLWALLRARRLQGAKFRRQQPLGPYVVDFFCQDAQLVVEVDGAQHFPPSQYDKVRDTWLNAAGLTVLRFANHEILGDPNRVLQRISDYLSRR